MHIKRLENRLSNVERCNDFVSNWCKTPVNSPMPELERRLKCGPLGTGYVSLLLERVQVLPKTAVIACPFNHYGLEQRSNPHGRKTIGVSVDRNVYLSQ